MAAGMTRYEKIKAMLCAWLGPGLIPDSPLDDRMGKVLDVIEPLVRAEQPTPTVWRMAGCACPVDARPGERCSLNWTRCNERLRYLRPAPAVAAPRPEAEP